MVPCQCGAQKDFVFKLVPRHASYIAKLSVTRCSSIALRVGKSKTKDGLKAIWNSFATMLISATLDRLSIPASMKGLSNSSSSSLAIASLTMAASCLRT
eukprot:Skav207863  [mRNA]  locus=scaffold1988:104585:105348:- [translate_table: standard]